ncbi:6-hydroxymethylpterin diphosphokinase MptE-like protein [Paraglaciecola sp. 2405UD69-4]|uniref:6-hydroxymethylpterin diphosphokinase MptE-like protein n=1 Tax=Paraglaciecola sp. 2405UD69-4 TaxID=3391836 RepID=UPI0039C9022D
MNKNEFEKLNTVLKLTIKSQYKAASKLLSTVDRNLLSENSKVTFDKVTKILSEEKPHPVEYIESNSSGKGVVYCILAMGHETDVLKMTVSPLIQQLSSDDSIFILFNGFKEHSLKVHLEKHSGVHVWESTANLGVAGGRNLLYSKALSTSYSFEYVVTLDNDVIVPNDFNKIIKEELVVNYDSKNVGILGAVILDYKKQKVKNFISDNFLGFPGYLSSINYNLFTDDIKQFINNNKKKLDTILWHIGIDKSYQDAYIERTDLYQTFRQEKQTYFPFLAHAPSNTDLISQDLFEVSNVPGCLQIISTANMKEAGLLDERFSPYFFEDSEYSIRLMKMGKSNYISTEIALFHGTDNRHLERKKVGSKFDFFSNEYRARVILFDKLGVENGLVKLIHQSLVRFFSEKDTTKALPELVAALVGMRRGMIQLGKVDEIGDKLECDLFKVLPNLEQFIQNSKASKKVNKEISFSNSLPDPKKDLPQVYFSQLKKFRNIYEGQDCLIVCNGPSLKDTNLGLFAGMPTFCVNSTFILQEQLDFKPDFFTVEDNHVIDDNLDNIVSMKSGVKFFPNKYREKFGDVNKTYYLPTIWDCYWKSKISHENPEFSEDITRGVYTGQTVTYLNLQLAYYMGFKRVFIVGLDFSYSIPKGSKIDNNSIDHDDDDPNHFHASYFGKGRQWHFPKLDSCMVSYTIANERFNRDGREVIDLTKNGCLNVFRKSTVEVELDIEKSPKSIDKGLSFKQYLLDLMYAKYCLNKSLQIDYMIHENNNFVSAAHNHIHSWVYTEQAKYYESLLEAVCCKSNNQTVAYLKEKIFVSSDIIECYQLPFCDWLSSQMNVKYAELTDCSEANAKLVSESGVIFLPNNAKGIASLKLILKQYAGISKVVVYADNAKVLIKYID